MPFQVAVAQRMGRQPSAPHDRFAVSLRTWPALGEANWDGERCDLLSPCLQLSEASSGIFSPLSPKNPFVFSFLSPISMRVCTHTRTFIQTHVMKWEERCTRRPPRVTVPLYHRFLS